MATTEHNERTLQARFRRHECKYLVSERLAAQIRDHVQPYVAPDPYAATSPDLSYDITSLYLDSPDLKLFWETEEGRARRLKLRIRTYADAADTPVFLEIKRRCNALVLKGRARIEREAVTALLTGRAPATTFRSNDQRACYEEFVGWLARWLAQPTIWVRYRREAYVGTINRDLRVTMDRNLVCAPAGGTDGMTRTTSWQPVENRMVVLEVKFDDSYPDWVARMIRRFQLQRRSFSKYGRSVKRGLDRRTRSALDAWALGA